MKYKFLIIGKINFILKKNIYLKYACLKKKYLCFFVIIYLIKIYLQSIHKNNIIINKNYIQIQKKINISFNNRIKSKLNIGIYAFGIKNGGRARSTALLINYFKNIAIFNLYLFTRRLKEDDEYKIPQNIKRILVNKNLINKIKKNKIQILIYQLSLHKEIKQLNNFNNVKVIFYQHLGIFDWIYGNYNIFKSIYRDYRYSKYVVNIIPFENDYLFQKWGISSIYMNNFMTYNYFNILQSDLSTKRILMIGRGDAKKKRFEIGIEAMEYIKEAIPQSEMIIISDLKGILHHEILINTLNPVNTHLKLG